MPNSSIFFSRTEIHTSFGQFLKEFAIDVKSFKSFLKKILLIFIKNLMFSSIFHVDFGGISVEKWFKARFNNRNLLPELLK